ncbi:MAG: leucine-rich repeat protein [Eubacterium sp.]|nr:leucine-rich repeat protein [Eubacterium sp.]
MKKTSKKITSLVLVFAFCFTSIFYFGIHAFAARSDVIMDSNNNVILRWNLRDDGVFTVSGNGYGPDYTQFNVPWRSVKSSIKEVIIEEGVQAVGNYWFYGCTNVTKVTLPDSMYKMGARCFQNCNHLTSIEMPEGCTEYYNYNFYGCSALKWAVLPSDNTNNSHSIPDNTFSGCSSLENVWVGSGHTGISSDAFKNCSSLTSIIWCGDTISSVSSNFPSNVSFVGKSNIESWCSSNSKNFVNIEDSVSDTLSYSYDLNTKKLTLSGSGNMSNAPWDRWKYFIYDVDLGNPSGICADAFKGCEYLSGELIIPSSVTKIESDAFSGAGYDYYIFEAQSIRISDSAFGGKEKLTFLGKNGCNAYNYVSSKESDNPGWKYYCIDRHDFDEVGGECGHCDKVQGASIIEPLGEHNYVYQCRVGNTLYYKCTHCTDEYSVNLRDLSISLDSALSTESEAYSETGYDGRFDIVRDGYVNGRDYAVIDRMLSGEKTEYDMMLSNENATQEAQRLYAYIASNYGSRVISGQQESTWMDGNNPQYEMNYIYNSTGKYPAIRGLDFMNDDFSGVVSRAKAWANRGGIVTICWHCGTSFSGSFNESQNQTFTDEEWEAVLTKGTAENTAFLNAMDKAGNALKQLQNEGVPVLWRPFHEFDGAWFWWGKGGSERFKRLWIMMYEHFTYDLGLNNLIWVLGYSHNGMDYGTNLADWYPGHQYCDIVGADSYEVAQNGAEKRLYNPVYSIVQGRKPLAMHETGLNPTVEQFQDVPWVYFMTWHTNYLTDENSTSALNTLYNSDYVITLDEVDY